MRKIILTFAIITSLLTTTAQEVKVIAAKKYLEIYEESEYVDATYLEKAKQEIDLASENPETKDKLKTLFYKGETYFQLFKRNYHLEYEKNKDVGRPKADTLNFLGISKSELFVAYDAFFKAKLLDTDRNYNEKIIDRITEINIVLKEKGKCEHMAKNYASALSCFEKAYEITSNDTTLFNNTNHIGSNDIILLQNTAICAMLAHNYEKAKHYYEIMVNRKVTGGSDYVQLMTSYLGLNDTIAAIETLKKGQIVYPTDVDLLKREIDLYVRTNKISEALAKFNQAIALQPTEALFYFLRGGLYEQHFHSKENPTVTNEDMNRIEADYKKAIELKPDYFDALYNLGAFYYNNGVLLINKIGGDQKNHPTEIAKANEEYTKALPILEKAHSIDNANAPTIKALKNIYYQLQMKEKGDEMKAKIGN